MRKGVNEACGTDAKGCPIQTFHSLCAWILRLSRDLGLPADFVIYDEQDSIDLLDCAKAGRKLALAWKK